MPSSSTEPREVVQLDLSAGSLHTTLVDGQPHVILRPAVEALGLDWKNQYEKLKTRSWASVVQSTMQIPGDTQARIHSLAPVRTFLMLLATVNENRVKAETRPTLVAFQNETADAIEAYWTRGGVISERASDDQLDALQQQIEERRIRRALGLVQLIAAMDDSVDPKWKRSRQLHHYAEATGEVAEIAPEDRALLVETYLKDRGLTTDERRSVRSSFGRRVSLGYEMQHGEKPKDSFGLVDGRERSVKSYTEADRPLFDKVWSEFYADRYPAQQQLGGAA
ncbi:phage antirepressor N-terminal domain-containing protein [Streptomyces sp. A3M-1-3]|uniref:phage antirepressor N-terminal domain-containing protein n=1 Tax=Streptomyces sp. A3M-1-3 TaxID=2962044 RepID=UPI0020B8644D|nr:phage antirepressor N-terminal domain-containing protein [Streptomyces sp. A3M-1-3]MCP3820131.1 phage antirepressor N-terminal domain-containing protein [Streptomyces sp. A3M-1-3]